MADYKITKAAAFTIEGEHGTYEIPLITELDFDGLAVIVDIQDEKDLRKRWKKIKDFILRMAPDIKNEDLQDAGYISLYSAYENYRPAQMGESTAS